MELYHNDEENAEEYIDLTPALDAARAACTALGPSSPIAAHDAHRGKLLGRLNKLPIPQTRQAATTQATNIVTEVSPTSLISSHSDHS